jgi:hypothetical protein
LSAVTVLNPYIAHVIGDFILQTDWMAVNKKRNSFACAVHVVVYMLPYLLCDMVWWQLLIIAVEHFAQDRSEFVNWFMRSVKGAKGGYGTELPLLVDQAFHLVTIEVVILLPRLVG